MCNFVRMNVEELREYCLSLKHAAEDMPFDEDTLVFKVAGKMFCLTSLSGDFGINLKCDPAEAEELRETFSAVTPGCHMNKKHWNTVKLDGSISDSMLKVWILKSYRLVIAGLPKQTRKQLELDIPEKTDK